jgi:hypothetical protein
MSTAVWPPIEDAQLAREQAASQARELDWLLVQLRETLQSLKAGLEECAALLAPTENGSTLVLSSVRSESLKGLVTRVGTRIVKGVCPRPPAVVCPLALTCAVLECQAAPLEPPSASRVVDIRPGHLVGTACAHARRPAADGGADVDKHLPRCH